MAQKQERDIMTWTSYLVSLNILSPIHVGWRKEGNLQLTRPYVTGRALWGAMTARLVRDQGSSNYEEMGKKVDEQLRFTYFYPSMVQDKIEIWPWDNQHYFSWMYLGSYSSATLKNKIAREGMLHETEYISPRTRDGRKAFLVGYIFEKKGCELEWRNALKRIQIGGERGYGWGRILPTITPKMNGNGFNGYEFNEPEDVPEIIVQKNKPILAHALINRLNCIGIIEPLIGRETNKNKGFGDIISKADVCWAPGSKVKANTKFQILEKGIWKKCR